MVQYPHTPVFEVFDLTQTFDGRRVLDIQHLKFEAGKITGAKLRHYLPLSELSRELPAVEQKEDQSQEG